MCRYYPKFPELYSPRINSLIITALKYVTEHYKKVWNKLPFWVFDKEILIHFPASHTFFPLFDQEYLSTCRDIV